MNTNIAHTKHNHASPVWFQVWLYLQSSIRVHNACFFCAQRGQRVTLQTTSLVIDVEDTLRETDSSRDLLLYTSSKRREFYPASKHWSKGDINNLSIILSGEGSSNRLDIVQIMGAGRGRDTRLRWVFRDPSFNFIIFFQDVNNFY